DQPAPPRRINRPGLLVAVCAAALLLLLLYFWWPDNDTAAYCVAGSAPPSASVTPVEVPLCRGGYNSLGFTGRNSLHFRDVNVRLIRDDHRLYLIDNTQD